MNVLTSMWAELEIEPTKEIKIIKKAYARQQEQERVRKGLQSHKMWEDYLKTPIFLEAVHDAGFLLSLQRRIEKLKFRPKTIRMIKDVIIKEGGEILEQLPNVKKILEKEGPRKSRNNYIIATFGALAMTLAIIFGAFSMKSYHARKMAEMDKIRYHSCTNVETYLEDKYQIECTVESSYFTGLHSTPVLKITPNESNDYYDVQISEPSETMPERFRALWDKDSMDPEEIQDSFAYESAFKYAQMYDISFKPFSSPQIVISMAGVPSEEIELKISKIMQFLSALQESELVQNGENILVKFEVPGKAMQVNVLLRKDKQIDEERVCYHKC